ncbi:MAG: Phosphoglycerate kinase [Ktedonobacterales bacterium]|jgi:phosphoglycerate kinase|nr:MAG: Phosphoglycerate kinase [Ktedonobacterales bacterium]
MDKATVRDIDVRGKRVLERVDFNVPLDERGAITDDTRIRASLPTIQYLLDAGASVVLMSHLGRPKGKVNLKYSLKPVAERLSALLGCPVQFAPECVGAEAERMALSLRTGDVLLLENLRFHPEEEANDPTFAKQLAALGEVYVNDAFGSAHRAHASTEGVAHDLPAVAGLLMEKELNFLGGALEHPKRPFVAISGGAKVSDKIAVLDRLIDISDAVLIGGGMANTFFKANGLSVGDSLAEDDKLDEARRLMAKARATGKRFVLPVDVALADRFAADADRVISTPDHVPDGWRILDVGPQTLVAFGDVLADAQTILWNGTMGVAEFPAFAQGTNALINLLIERTEEGAITIVGGGDSAAAVEAAGAASKLSHVSTGGGASLEFLEGRELPGVAALRDKGDTGDKGGAA